MTSLAASMTINALVTVLIVFRIFKVFHEVKDVTGGKKLCSIIFIIIESGMALFAIQLACLVIAATEERTNAECNIYLLIGCIHKMLNVVISSVTATLYITKMWRLRYNTYHHPGAGVNGTIFLGRAIFSRICW
jgi:hypothetical protein